MQKFLKHFRKSVTFFPSNKGEPCTSANGIDRWTMKDTEFQEISRLPELKVNSKEVILSVSLAMCNTESLTTKTRKSMNAFKNEIESEEESVCCFISPHYLLLPLTISFLLRGNLITSVTVDSSLCQLWFRYKFVKALSEFTGSSFRICKCLHWCGNWEYWCWCSSEIRYLFCWECTPDSSAELILLLVLL